MNFKDLIKVVNVSKKKPNAEGIEYVGRATANGWEESPLHNPYHLRNRNDKEEREEVIQDYRSHLWEKIQENGEEKEELLRLARMVKEGEEVDLGCWCSPLPCHADVIKNAIAWLIETEQV